MKLITIIALLFISQFCFGQSVFNKMADFKKVTSPYPETVLLLGYYAANDNGGGTFTWVDSSTKNDNGGTVIKPGTEEGNGRYERVMDGGSINVLWFGAKKGGTVDASAAINAAISSSPTYVTTWSGTTSGHGRVIIPSGVYKMSAPIIIRTTVSLEGDGAGMFPYQEVQLRYDGNTSGIIILADNHNGGGRSVTIKNLYLRNFGASTDSGANGIYTNTRIVLENCGFDNFSGNGIMFHTNDSGNANNSIVSNVTSYYNAKNGFFCSGNESNNINIYNSNFQANGMCGVLDRSFIGINLFGCHTSSNGLRNATGYNRSWCTYGGKVYQSIFYTNQKNIEPTVNANWKTYWIENKTVFGGALQPAAWSADSTYWITGSYVVAGPSATTHLYGCYSEGGQGANNLNQFSVAWGGNHGAIFANKDNIYINPSAYQLLLRGAGMKAFDKDSVQTFIGWHNTFGEQIGSEKTGHSIFQRKYFEASRTVIAFVDNSTGNQSYSLIGKGFDPAKMGLSVLPRTGMMLIPYDRGILLGDANNGNISRSFLASRTGPPTSLAHAAGDYAHNMGGDTSISGWRAIVAGTPGTWRPIKSGNFMLGNYTPSSGADPTGKTGDISWDNGYLYIKTSAGWKRTLLESF